MYRHMGCNCNYKQYECAFTQLFYCISVSEKQITLKNKMIYLLRKENVNNIFREKDNNKNIYD